MSMEKNYQLIIVEGLRDIGFNFEFKTLNEVTKYTKQFIKDNREKVIMFLYPFATSEDDFIESLKNRPADFEFPEVDEIIPRLERLSKGKIIQSDYFFVVHPRFKDDSEMLYRIWEKRYLKYVIDIKIVLYDQSNTGLDQEEAINLVLYNDILRWLVRRLPMDEFLWPNYPFKDINDEISLLNHKIREIERDEKRDSKKKTGRTLKGFYKMKINILQKRKYHKMFSMSEITIERVSRIYNKMEFVSAPYNIYETTSIDEKEKVIRFYLKKQSADVIQARNSRGKGKNTAKRKMIKEYLADNPSSNNSEVARALNVDRKTVKKYR